MERSRPWNQCAFLRVWHEPGQNHIDDYYRSSSNLTIPTTTIVAWCKGTLSTVTCTAAWSSSSCLPCVTRLRVGERNFQNAPAITRPASTMTIWRRQLKESTFIQERRRHLDVAPVSPACSSGLTSHLRRPTFAEGVLAAVRPRFLLGSERPAGVVEGSGIRLCATGTSSAAARRKLLLHCAP